MDWFAGGSSSCSSKGCEMAPAPDVWPRAGTCLQHEGRSCWGGLARPVAPHLPCLQPWGGAQDHVCPPGEDQCCALQPRGGQQWGSHPALCPSILQRDRSQLLLAWVGVGSRGGGNSSGRDLGMLRLFPNFLDNCPVPCTQGRDNGVPDVPPSWQPLCHTSGLGQHPPPCAAPMGCGLLAGAPAVPKRPWGGAARHLLGVLGAHPEGLVLCVLVPFPQAR